MGKPSKPSLVDTLKQMPPRPRSWKSAMTKEQMAEMEELRAAYRRGELRHLTLTAILKAVQERFGVKIHRCSFSEWLNEEESEKKE